MGWRHRGRHMRKRWPTSVIADCSRVQRLIAIGSATSVLGEGVGGEEDGEGGGSVGKGVGG